MIRWYSLARDTIAVGQMSQVPSSAKSSGLFLSKRIAELNGGGRVNTFPDPVMWGLNLEQWKAIAEAQRLNLEQLRAQNNELKSLLVRAAEALEVWKGYAFSPPTKALIDELRKAAKE